MTLLAGYSIAFLHICLKLLFRLLAWLIELPEDGVLRRSWRSEGQVYGVAKYAICLAAWSHKAG
jgi:hypothetical protein